MGKKMVKRVAALNKQGTELFKNGINFKISKFLLYYDIYYIAEFYYIDDY